MMQFAGDSSPERCFLSIIIPALNEAEALPVLLSSLDRQDDSPRFEVVLVDGGSRDDTVESFRSRARAWALRGRPATVLVTERAGRAYQMNAGARASTGEALLFLHADTHLRAGAIRSVAAALDDPRIVGGGFRHHYRDSNTLLRVISFYATARSLLFGVHYGDQGLFMRRSAFDAVGGFPDMPLFEDLAMARAMRGQGRVTTLSMPVDTSARRLIRGGVARTALQFCWMKIRHARGIDPVDLKRRYPDVR